MMGRRIVASTRRDGVRWAAGALLLYTATTLVLLYPGSLHPGSVIIGEPRGDAYEYVWSLWWFKRAVFEPGKTQTHLTLMNHPQGIEHPFLLTMIAVPLLALPFSLISPVLAYNVSVLFSFILSGMAMYWLCLELTGDRRAGLVGGFIFAFFLNKTGHVMAGHLPQATVYLFPLYVLFLRRVIRTPEWRTVLPATLTLAVAGLVHVMHLAYLVAPVTLSVLLIHLLERRGTFFSRRRSIAMALVFGLAALIGAPFLVPTILESTAGGSYLYKTGTVDASTDLLAFFTPSRYHPLLGPLGLLPPYAERVFRSQEYLWERLAYPGVLATGLALGGLLAGKGRREGVWGTLALMAAVLSMGPLLKVGETLVRYQVDGHGSHVVLPYALLKQLPLLSVGRTPGRLNGTVMFAVAILAAYGVAGLASRLARRPRLLALLLGVVLVGIGLEVVAVWPFPTAAAGPPPSIRAIAAEPGNGALLYLGTSRSEINHRALYYQTIAQRPIVAGRVHRTLPEVVPWRETLSGLAEPERGGGDVVPRPALADRPAWLRRFDVDYVLFFHAMWWGDRSNLAYLDRLLGAPRYDDGALAAFAVPFDVSPPGDPYLYTMSIEGWHGPEEDGGRWRRWMCNDGQVYLYATRQQAGNLRLALDSRLDWPVVEVFRDEDLLDGLIVGGPTVHTTRPFTLTQGMNVFRFHLPDGADVVLDDPRCWEDALLAPPDSPSPVPCRPADADLTCRTVVFDAIRFVPTGDLAPGEGLDLSLGGRVRLRGWALAGEGPPLHAGSPLSVTLTWEPEGELTDAVVGFVHLVASDGALVAQHDRSLLATVGEAAAWPPGAALSSTVTLDLPQELPPGEYRLLAGAYLWPSLERLPVAEAGTDVVELGDVTVGPP